MATRDRGSVRYHRGGWELTVWVAGDRTIRRHPGPDTRAGRRDAEQALEALARSVGAGTDGMTVAQVLERYKLARWADWAPSTRASYPHHVAPILAVWGDRAVESLTLDEIEVTYGQWRTDGMQPSTLRRHHTPFAAALNLAARRWHVIAASPAAGIRLPTVAKSDATELRDLDPVLDAIDLLAPSTDPLRRGHRRLQVAARLAVASGSRRGELVGVRWRDLRGGVLYVDAAMSMGPGAVVERKGTKADTAKKITLDDDMLALLVDWRKECQVESLALGAGRVTDDRPILPSPTDPTKPWVPDRITRTWVRHRDAIGLPGMKFHQLRHLHASALLSAGVPIPVVSARLGHRSARMTLEVYGQAMPADDAAAAAVIGGARRRSPR